MKKTTFERYRISGKKVVYMELTEISIPEDETLSMVCKYKFDTDSTQKMIDEAISISNSGRIKQEEKEYNEMNYAAIYRRLSQLSIHELIKKIFGVYQ